MCQLDDLLKSIQLEDPTYDVSGVLEGILRDIQDRNRVKYSKAYKLYTLLRGMSVNKYRIHNIATLPIDTPVYYENCIVLTLHMDKECINDTLEHFFNGKCQISKDTSDSYHVYEILAIVDNASSMVEDTSIIARIEKLTMQDAYLTIE